MHAEVCCGHFKGAAGPGARLFKDQRDIFALAQAVGDAGLFLGLEILGKVEKTCDFIGSQIQQLEKTFLIQ